MDVKIRYKLHHARLARLDAPGVIHHVIIRGIEKASRYDTTWSGICNSKRRALSKRKQPPNRKIVCYLFMDVPH